MWSERFKRTLIICPFLSIQLNGPVGAFDYEYINGAEVVLNWDSGLHVE